MSLSDGSLPSLLLGGFLSYLAIEVLFYAVFHLYMIPRANQRTRAMPYRDYGNERHRLLCRVLDRIAVSCEQNSKDYRKAGDRFLYQWFQRLEQEEEEAAEAEQQIKNLKSISNHNNNNHKGKASFSQPVPPPPLLHTESTMSSCSSDDANSVSSNEETVSSTQFEGIGREEMNEFFSWAFFSKDYEEMLPWELKELQLCFDMKEKRLGITYEPGRLHKFRPRRLSIDRVNALHRPLLVYAVIWSWTLLMGLFLRVVGFQRVVSSKTGVTGWYRPARDEAAAKMLPFLFFHGLAPGGVLFYTPMVLIGFVNDGRASFLFENPNISCCLGFTALTEAQTVDGVTEIVNKFCSPDQGLALCGHSFGSVPMTWLLHSPAFRDRIRQFVLLDPVTILLSEPDVMVNFLYSLDTSGVRILAGSELFTVYYLRRHFSWYNSELWLDDIPNKVQSVIALSEADTIVNASKVKDHLDASVQKEDGSLKVCFWKGVGHANCIAAPSKWRELKEVMLRQELDMVKQMRE